MNYINIQRQELGNKNKSMTQIVILLDKIFSLFEAEFKMKVYYLF